MWCWQELWHCWFCDAGPGTRLCISQALARLCSPGAAGSHALQAAEGTLNTSLELTAWLLPEKFRAFPLECSAALHLKEVTWALEGWLISSQPIPVTGTHPEGLSYEYMPNCPSPATLCICLLRGRGKERSCQSAQTGLQGAASLQSPIPSKHSPPSALASSTMCTDACRSIPAHQIPPCFPAVWRCPRRSPWGSERRQGIQGLTEGAYPMLSSS